LDLQKELFKRVGKLRNVLAVLEGAVKKVFAILEMCWHLLKKLIKIVSKLRNMPAFPELVVKKVLASIEMYSHSQKELLKKYWQA